MHRNDQNEASARNAIIGIIILMILFFWLVIKNASAAAENQNSKNKYTMKNQWIPNIKATVYFTQDGLPRRRRFMADTEEQLLTDVFMYQVERCTLHNIEIKQVHYRGQLLQWNDFLAHRTFAKGRMSFDEFKAAILNQPQELTA